MNCMVGRGMIYTYHNIQVMRPPNAACTADAPMMLLADILKSQYLVNIPGKMHCMENFSEFVPEDAITG